jgi:exodeoxyribonuclease VII large subunit
MLSVSELNEQIKASLEATFEDIVVEGEVSSATYHSSGHLYFSIKDDKSSLKCVMWRSSVARMKFRLEVGEHIVLSGNIGVYTPRGEYQFIARKIEPFGQGALALAFEQLKAKLEAKGYFETSSKKPLPKFIKKLAVVTALNSAAFEDILKVANKRWPLVEIIGIDTLVQGEMAAKEIVRAIKYADSLGCDVILVSRGGGSKEDLWCFNEEIVADAIFEAKTPVVSAIGHEIDVLISDFVADVRAPTPSGAIEMILPNKDDYLFLLDDLEEKYNFAIENKLKKAQDELAFIESKLNLVAPLQKITYYYEEFERLKELLYLRVKQRLLNANEMLEPLKRDLERNYTFLFKKKKESLESIKKQLLFYNPAERFDEAFVEVIKDGQKVNICSLKEKDVVELVNNKCKVKVVVLGDKSYF